jgi:hypothetical protein
MGLTPGVKEGRELTVALGTGFTPLLTVALGIGVIPVYKIESSRMPGPEIMLGLPVFPAFSCPRCFPLFFGLAWFVSRSFSLLAFPFPLSVSVSTTSSFPPAELEWELAS